MPNRQITKKQIALLHVAKAQLGLSDEVYRDMLGSVGVYSSVQLTGRQYNEIMRRLESGGFRAVGSHRPTPQAGNAMRRLPDAGDEVSHERRRLLGKIDKLLEAQDLPASYALGIARRMWGVDKLTWLNPNQLRGVVAALVKKQRKERRDAV